MAALIAQFYKFKKQQNSTAVPNDTTILYNLPIRLKSGSSIANPVLEISQPVENVSFTEVNYCRILGLNRYYYVMNMEYDRGLWIVTLKVDVMASYRGEIGADTRYILRSSAESDGSLTDLAYPTKNKVVRQVKRKRIWSAETIEEGCYIVTTLANQGEGLGAAKLWGLTHKQFDELNDKLFGAGDFTIADFVVNSELVNKLLNPGQYIVSCVWYPFSIEKITSKTEQEALFIGKSGIAGVKCYAIWSESHFIEELFVLSLADYKHPQIERGAYMAKQPFSRYRLYIPGFGVVPFDVVSSDYAQAAVVVGIDLITSTAILTVTNDAGEVYKTTASFGIRVPMCQSENGMLSKMANVFTQMAGTVAAGARGDLAGTISGGLSSIESAWNCSSNMQHFGVPAGCLNIYNDYATLEATYFLATDEDVNRKGRPLHARRQIDKIPGFIICGDGYTKISGLCGEYDEVNRIMKEGFYYE